MKKFTHRFVTNALQLTQGLYNSFVLSRHFITSYLFENVFVQQISNLLKQNDDLLLQLLICLNIL